MTKKPRLIFGGSFEDERGRLDFINYFNAQEIKRVYFTTHPKTSTIRAWQGHTVESRWFICVQGSFQVKIIEVDDWENPSEDLEVHSYVLSSSKPEVLFVPEGCLNGFKAIEENSKLMIMSNYGMNEIEDDQVRFDKEKWNQWEN
tara:strand:+ start:208 stop:642 length:435 start_codon:yes stop_codon:yes gene_type:complete